MGIEPRPGPDEVVAAGDDVRPVVRPAADPDSGSARIGKPVAAASAGERGGQAPGRRLRPGDDEAAPRRREPAASSAIASVVERRRGPATTAA